MLKPRPNMPDEQATAEAITEGCVVCGSPATLKFRQHLPVQAAAERATI